MSAYKEGQLVVVAAKMKQHNGDNQAVGTYIGQLTDKQVQVLLPNGYIFTGSNYEIYEYMKETK